MSLPTFHLRALALRRNSQFAEVRYREQAPLVAMMMMCFQVLR